MSNELTTWLLDIQKAIDEINSFLPDPRLFEKFQRDIKTQRAVERNLEIIGEAISRVLKEYPTIEISDSRKIVDTRNRIIHGYDSVSPDVLWGIVIRHLPILKTEVKAILEK